MIDCVGAAKKLACFQCSVSWRVVMMEHPIAITTQFRSFAPNVFPQTLENGTVELCVDSLSLGDEFPVHNTANVEKNDKHAFGRASDLPRLLQSWKMQPLPLRRPLFCLWVIAVDPTLITNDDPRHEGWVIEEDVEEDPCRLQHGAASACRSGALAQTWQQRSACSNRT